VVVIRQVLIGVEYLHAHEIAHRDLKPDNILMTSLEDGARVVITDFGNARFLPKSAGMSNHQTAKYQRMFSYVGTLEFAAPEIHKANRSIPADGGYTKSVDMWSIGSITATVLSGEAIFSDRTHPQYYDNPRLVIIGLAAQCDLSVLDDEYHPLWSEVNFLSKDFIKRLLVLDEDDRMTATEALAHVWFANDCYAEDLEDLYMRSVEGWQPRPVSSQLIERISRSLPDLTAIGLPEQIRIPNTVSHFFRPSEQRMTQNTMPICSTSHRRRTNTPLPSITDDYANDKFQFASQISPFYGANDLGCTNQYHDSVGSSDQQQQFHDEHHRAQREKERYSRYAYGSQETFNTVIQQGQATYDAAAQNQYITTHNTEREGSHGSTESLNNVNNVAYSQHPYIPEDLQPSINGSMEVILVPNTPVAEVGANADLIMDESFQQTRFPEEYRRDLISGNEHAYVLVYETPPDGEV
jgi:serine/threonine protein kinase